MKYWRTDAPPLVVRAWRTRTIIVCLLLLFLAGLVARVRAPELALFLVQTQDIPILALLCAATLLIAWWQPQWGLPTRLPSRGMLLLAALTLATLLAWGTYVLMGNFPLSRDEHMVIFDMAVFNSGHLAAPLPPAWRPYGLALVPNYLLNSDQPRGLISNYLPMNALLRLAFSKVADPAWFNPLLVLVGGAALLDIARRLFGPHDRACWVMLLIYLLSAQVLVTAMTPYAMTAHLAFNLVWLAGFLRGGKTGTSIALAAGFAATGLHQLVFHPFFVAPFLLWRLRDGEWRLVLGYAVAYAAIISWWAIYPLIVAPLVAGTPGAASRENFITAKLIFMLRMHDPRAVSIMILNLLRFTAWQNLALVPLLIAAIPIVRRSGGLPLTVAVGIVAWLLVIAIVSPGQGRGYGYRYLHGYIGSFAILAGYGYRELERRIGLRADGLVLLMSGLTLVAAIPMLVSETYSFMQPPLAMERLVADQRTPFVLIDDYPPDSTDGNWSDGGLDFVRNVPSTTRRLPLRFSAQALSPDLLARLCTIGPVTLVTKEDMHRVGFALNADERSPAFAKLVSTDAKKSDCYRAARLRSDKQ